MRRHWLRCRPAECQLSGRDQRQKWEWLKAWCEGGLPPWGYSERKRVVLPGARPCQRGAWSVTKNPTRGRTVRVDASTVRGAEDETAPNHPEVAVTLPTMGPASVLYGLGDGDASGD